ncbi:Uncharacterised protein g1312 [Pycnogonum litorale]
MGVGIPIHRIHIIRGTNMMKTLAFVLLLVVAAYSAPQYGKEQSGYGQQNGQINYKLNYEIDLPKDKHDAYAQWQVEDDARNANYKLQQYHPYGAKSNVYYAQESDH